MSEFKRYRDYTVVVGNGSGCIFQPGDADYSYVLTAKHNVKNINNSHITIMDCNGVKHNVIEKYEHPDKDVDAAIIKISRISNIDGPLRCTNKPDLRQKFVLYGYPETRRGNGVKPEIRMLDLEIKDREQNIIIAQPDNFPQQSEVMGFSGGGVFQAIGDNVYLLGIEYGMENVEDGRVRILFISVFDAIIANNKDLKPLINTNKQKLAVLWYNIKNISLKYRIPLIIIVCIFLFLSLSVFWLCFGEPEIKKATVKIEGQNLYIAVYYDGILPVLWWSIHSWWLGNQDHSLFLPSAGVSNEIRIHHEYTVFRIAKPLADLQLTDEVRLQYFYIQSKNSTDEKFRIYRGKIE